MNFTYMEILGVRHVVKLSQYKGTGVNCVVECSYDTGYVGAQKHCYNRGLM